MSAIAIRSLQFTWPGQPAPALVVPELVIAAGESVFIQGASGSGKSTLLNLISGMQLPSVGTVEVLGTDLASLRPRARDRFRANHIGLVFQQFNLIPYLDVETNVILGAFFGSGDAGSARQRARQLLATLELPASVLTQRADRLSVGQQQRVAIARAMINAPALLVVDEPTSALDADARDRFMELLARTWQEAACTTLFVSHDRSLAARFGRCLDMRDLNQARAPEPTDAV